MTFQHDADGVTPGNEAEGAPSGNFADESTDANEGKSGDGVVEGGDAVGDGGALEDGGAAENEVFDGASEDEAGDEHGATVADPPQHSRALLALVAAGTVAMAPIAGTVIAPAGSGYASHASPAYVLADLSHDIGRNDWAFQGGFGGRVIWAVTYVALALAWLLVTLWMRTRDRRAARAAAPTGRLRPRRLWLKTWGAVLAVEFAAGVLTIGAALYAQWTATSLGPVVLKLADVCSPWWSCAVALFVVARAERDNLALRAAIGYGAVLALVLLVPLPGPSDVKALILAATVAVPALLGRRAAVGTVQPAPTADSARPAPPRAQPPEALPIAPAGAGQLSSPQLLPDAAAAG